MEAIRKYINASSLMAVMALPESFKNHKLGVLIFPTEEKEIVTGRNLGGKAAWWYPAIHKVKEKPYAWLKGNPEKSGIPYQTLINLYLADCAKHKKRLQMFWK